MLRNYMFDGVRLNIFSTEICLLAISWPCFLLLKPEQGRPKDGYIPRHDQKCTLPLVKNGKIGNTSCLILCDLDLWDMNSGQDHCTSSQCGQY